MCSSDLLLLVAHIVSRANNEDLMLMYSLPAFAKGDPTSFLSGVARANQLLKKVCTMRHPRFDNYVIFARLS